jgi:hypothetical protein
MKSALNGGLNLSIQDGWWAECFDGDNGWAISSAEQIEDTERRDELEASDPEDEAAFAHDAPPPQELQTFAALGTSLLRHGCALTGQSPAAHSFDDLRIVPIRPLAEDGPVHVTNCLPLAPAAAEAFSAGQLTVADDLRVIVDVGRIDQDLLSRLNPLGRLAVPRDEALRPDRRHLAWHRRRFFSRLD